MCYAMPLCPRFVSEAAARGGIPDSNLRRNVSLSSPLLDKDFHYEQQRFRKHSYPSSNAHGVELSNYEYSTVVGAGSEKAASCPRLVGHLPDAY